jgi:hypothetical protein
MRFQLLSDKRILLVVPLQVDDSATIRLDLEPQRGRRRPPPGLLRRNDDAEQEAIDTIARHMELTSASLSDLASILNKATGESQLKQDLLEFARARDIDVDKLLTYLTSGGGSMTVRVGGREVHYENPAIRRRVPDDQSFPARLIPRPQDRNKVTFVGIAQTKPASLVQLPLRKNSNRRHEFSTASPQSAALVAAAQQLGLEFDVFLRFARIVRPGLAQILEIEKLADESRLASEVIAALGGEAPAQHVLFEATASA